MALPVLLAASMLAGPVSPVPSVYAAETDVMSKDMIRLDEKNFPDESFRRALEPYDLNGDGYFGKTEIESATKLELDNWAITDLTGIEYFTYVENLLCYGNRLESLDLSKNTELVHLRCEANKLTSLNLLNNKKLQYLYCGSNPLTELDLSGNSELLALEFPECSLTSIDLSKQTKMQVLDFAGNSISEIDLSSCTDMRYIQCSRNPVEKIDVSMMPHLYQIHANNTKLEELDVRSNPEMISLDCSHNNISELDITNQPVLEILDCGHNPISTLNLKNNSELFHLECDACELSELDLSKNTKLNSLHCDSNKLTELDVSNNPELDYFYCGNNNIKSLDLSVLPLLRSLECQNNPLGKLDVSKNPELDYLVCFNTGIKKLDVSACKELRVLRCEENKIGELDVSSCETLKDAYLNGDSYTYPNGVVVYGDFQLQDYDEVSVFIRSGMTVDGKMKINVGSDTPTPEPPTPEPEPPTPEPEPPTPEPEPPTPEPEPPTPTPEPTFEDFVERLYVVALGRASEAAGKKFWVEKVGSGEYDGAACARYFLLDAPEFMNRNLSVEEFVETLYKTFFDRESDAAGKKGWVDAIKTGKMTRAIVVENFIESTEWCNVCATYGVRSGAQWHKAEFASKNAINFATRLYTCCLGRDPEEKGLQYWSLALTNLEQTGCSAAKEFFKGQEFSNLKLKDDEYIRRLYTTFMDREPEASEVAYWAGELAGGTQTRDSVLSFFGQSEEFTKICKKYGIERGTI